MDHAILIDPLSERELQVLRRIAEVRSNQEIAERLVITMGTVKAHISHIYSKLDARGRTQAILKADQFHLLKPGAKINQFITLVGGQVSHLASTCPPSLRDRFLEEEKSELKEINSCHTFQNEPRSKPGRQPWMYQLYMNSKSPSLFQTSGQLGSRT